MLIKVIIKNMHIREAILLTKLIEFRSRTPPVVVISLKNDLFTGDIVNPGKVILRLLQIQRPGQISKQNCCILRADHR